MDGREALAGRYELRGVLGLGGMAEVYDGWDNRLNRAVAIKLLHPALTTDAEVRRRFEDEARAAAGLDHPHIVAVHDCGEHKGTPFIVMERLPGRTLADEIALGPLPPKRVRAVLTDVLGALATAHAAGVLHRDMKPSNLLIVPNSSAVKVADFGIAKTAGAAHTATGQIVGTMAYMSPERIAGAPASVADDLYAVGVMAYEALSGRRPFPQENPAALIAAILHSQPPPIAAIRPDVDPVVPAVIARAMARDVHQRFSSAEQMRTALVGDTRTAFAGPSAAPSRPATKRLVEPLAPSAEFFVPPARRRPMSRERKLLLTAAAFVALIVSAVALAVDPSSTTQPPEPISTSTTVPPPPTPAPLPPPAPSAVQSVERPGEGQKKGDEGRGNGNRRNPGHGNKKHE